MAALLGGAPPGMGEFPLFGGPLIGLGRRLGLVRGTTNSVPLGVALGALLWIVLAVLATSEGLGPKLFSLSVIGVHVRLLVAIPLFFVCETVLSPRMSTFGRELVTTQVVPAAELGVLETTIARLTRWQDSWLPEALCLLAAVLASVFADRLNLMGTTAALDASRTGQTVWTIQWFALVCLTVFRFLLLRWLLRILLWAGFLFRLGRMALHLVPTHPDGVGGLGYLEVVHSHFATLIFALSAVQSASMAEEVASGRLRFEDIYPGLAFSLVAVAVLFLAPMYLLAARLKECRVQGLADYMGFATRYVSEFDKKWIARGSATTGDVLGTSDLQSLADLSNSVRVVREMTLVPLTQRLLWLFGLSTVAPMLPLLLLKYPLAELAAKFLARLSGL